jgi:ABC-type sulfate transport system substrate-binding protein
MVMQTFKRGDMVFPKWSQRLPAFKVSQVGAIMVSLVDECGNREVMHKDDIVLQDPAVVYDRPRYEALG